MQQSLKFLSYDLYDIFILWRNDNCNKNGLTKMTVEKKQNIQDVFLNQVRKSKMPLTVFLVNGIKLQGIVTAFDNFCVLLRREGQVQLVYKHAISTVMPSGPVALYEAEMDDKDTA